MLGRDRMSPLLERGGESRRDPVAALFGELGEAGQIDEHHRRRRLRLRHRSEVLQREEALEALDDPLDAPTLEIASAQPREQLRREVGCRRVLAPHVVREHLDLSADQPFASRLTELLVDELDPSEGRDASPSASRRAARSIVSSSGTGPHTSRNRRNISSSSTWIGASRVGRRVLPSSRTPPAAVPPPIPRRRRRQRTCGRIGGRARRGGIPRRTPCSASPRSPIG